MAMWQSKKAAAAEDGENGLFFLKPSPHISGRGANNGLECVSVAAFPVSQHGLAISIQVIHWS